MMKNVYFLIVILCSVFASSQNSETRYYYLSDVDIVPHTEECKDIEKEKQSICFNTFISKHVQKHFFYPDEAQENKIQGKVFVSFIITPEGTLTEIKTKGDYEILNSAALKIIEKIPTLSPGIKDGIPVNVKVSFPLSYFLYD